MAAVKSYTSMEDAMKGVAKQVNGLRDDNGNRTARFYEMQDMALRGCMTAAAISRAGSLASSVKTGRKLLTARQM
ncbi:hypothetical protein RCN20_05835 [Escherichia coli]|nr:hypothetical protein [Escherichia coli]MEC9861717.1 hypothetical protein [Escherichia coli]MED9315200.1 hypothetical protein [Escherichia coli]